MTPLQPSLRWMAVSSSLVRAARWVLVWLGSRGALRIKQEFKSV
jgi:hypothetical protein